MGETGQKEQSCRLDRFLAKAAGISRSEAKKYVKEGRVLVDGRAAENPQERLAEGAAVLLDGKPLAYRKFVYLMLNKPAGVVSATEDAKERTVMDLLPANERNGLFPAGRLDKDAEGLLLLTNDGELAHRLLSPKKHVDKLYFVQLEREITKEDIEAFAQGLVLDAFLTARPAGLRYLTEQERNGFAKEGALAAVTLCEGKFHQVKRMFSATGNRVLYLKRMAMGSLYLDETLLPGAYRELTEEERKGLGKDKC